MSAQLTAQKQTIKPTFTPVGHGLLQRCTATAECDECRKKRLGMLQRAAVNSSPANEVPRIVHEVLHSPGHPLDAGTRVFMEPRFEHDFSDVRVHTDSKAAESARAVNALAYTVGQHIVFDAGRYAPATTEGRKLLTHEMAHVIQQSNGIVGTPQQISNPHDEHEQEANIVADNLEQRKGVSSNLSNSGSMVSRLIRQSLVTCPAGQNPFAADRRAAALLDNAIGRIGVAQAAHAGAPADPDVVVVSNAMRTAFRLDPANPDNWTLAPPHFGLPLILRRLEIARDYINSVVFTVNCVAAGAAHVIPGCLAGVCGAGTEALSCHANPTSIDLCPIFWTGRNLNQRGRIWAHEVFHIDFGFINDWGQPDSANAHCYAQFVALLNDFNSTPGYRCH